MSETVISRRVPGQYTRESLLRLRMRCLLVLGAFAVVTDVLGRALDFQGIEFELSELGLLGVCLAILRFAIPVVERLDQGATGEELVGGLLDELSHSGWHVMHDAVLGSGNVDHIAVGPAGVFTFETKSSPKPVRVRRLHGAIIRQAQAQRDRVERVAGVRAEPFVVFSQAWVDSPGTRRKGVRVVPARMLLTHLRQRPPALSPEQVSEIQRRLHATLGA
jgi:hypothetical protein